MSSSVALRCCLQAFVCLTIPLLTTSMLACPPCKCSKTVADCSGLRLTHIPSLPATIRVLNFASNNLGNLSTASFRNVRGIRVLNISDNFINDVTKDTFSALNHDIRELDMSNNKFSSPIKVYRALSSTNLHQLSLLNNSLHFSNFNALEPLSNVPLRRLYLGRNLLKTLIGNLTKSLPKLQTLDLERNLITDISFADVHEELTELNIDRNKLRDLRCFCLKQNTTTSSLPRLQKLSLFANLLTTLQEIKNSNTCLQSLKTLILDDNHFVELGGNAFAGLPKLQTLSLYSATLQSPTIHQALFNSTSLRNLTFGSFRRDITADDPFLNLFSFSPNLTYLKLSGFSFSKWTNDTMRKLFSPLTKIQYLLVVRSNVIIIPAHFLPALQNLVYLDFGNNYISSWDPSVFRNATTLKTLMLSSNHITSLNESFLSKFMWENIEILDLSFNPFDCSCELYWFRQWLKKNSKKIKNYPKAYFCKSPSEYKDKRLIGYDPSYRDCHPLSTVVITLIVCACVLVASVSIAAILYRNRWNIKYYLYLLSKHGYEKIPGNDSFLYDAFVAYNSSERVWVISKLRKFLENDHGMKLCLHERDFSVGKLIVDNIVDNIRQSRKVILILSNNFAKSQWCQFETLMAHERFAEEGAASLVLVMFEDVSYSHLNGPLSLLLKSTTYLQWSKDPVAKEIFWNKLLDSLR